MIWLQELEVGKDGMGHRWWKDGQAWKLKWLCRLVLKLDTYLCNLDHYFNYHVYPSFFMCVCPLSDVSHTEAFHHHWIFRKARWNQYYLLLSFTMTYYNSKSESFLESMSLNLLPGSNQDRIDFWPTETHSTFFERYKSSKWHIVTDQKTTNRIGFAPSK